MPYLISKVKKSVFTFNISKMPSHTPKLGIWIKYPKNQKYTNKLSFEKDIFTQIIEQLPKVDYFTHSFDPSITNWLPFYWKGYRQTTKYTYRIDDLTNIDTIKSSFRSNIKTDIKKAVKQNVKVVTTEKVKDFYKVSQKTFRRQNLDIKYTFESLKKIYEECSKRDQAKIFLAKDENENVHAGAFLVWDDNCAYYLKGGGDPEFRNSGATSLLIWEMIQFSSNVTKKFDFEGSMIEPIERFFRSFGATQTPYFLISKSKNKFIEFGLNLL